ncbi:MAG: glycine betaine/proline transport system permease protein [Rhodoferax sp.]|jgi:glycine betaine/proline transport system permease protein
MTWINEFPQMGDEQLRALRQTIDGAFRTFSRNYGEALERLFDPLRDLLMFSERLLTQSPWLAVIGVIALIAWLASRSPKIVIGTVLTLLAIGYFGMWEDTMKTISMIFVSTLLALALGLPIGTAMSRWDSLQKSVNPALDVMQTMPSFVYLIPVVMLLGIGRVAGMIAVVVYAIPPVIRFTNLGIRLVNKDLLEAADAFGASTWQKMTQVQLPLALPTIMAGVNQTIMLSLAMVVIAAMIGVQGLGQPVLKSIANQYFTMGMLNGLAIVGIAIIFDRISQTYGKRLQKHLEVVHG